MVRRAGSRLLIVGDERYRWSLRHRHEQRAHDAVPGFADCREVVGIWREGLPGRLEVVFRAGTGRAVPDGRLHAGAVIAADGVVRNLNEPGVVRALLDEALARGWHPTHRTHLHLDGWSLLTPA
jgi:hypothetical protein